MLEAENFKLYCNQTLTGKLLRKKKKKEEGQFTITKSYYERDEISFNNFTTA
jgi:hypothetical protein